MSYEAPDLDKQILEPGRALAEAVRALREVKAEKKAAMQGFSERLENLQNVVHRISNDILTGQQQIFPPDSEPGKSQSAGAN